MDLFLGLLDNIFKASYDARLLLGIGTNHSSFLFSPRTSHVRPSPVQALMPSQVSPGKQTTLKSLRITKVFPQSLWQGLLISAPQLLSGPFILCPLDYEAATGRETRECAWASPGQTLITSTHLSLARNSHMITAREERGSLGRDQIRACQMEFNPPVVLNSCSTSCKLIHLP